MCDAPSRERRSAPPPPRRAGTGGSGRRPALQRSAKEERQGGAACPRSHRGTGGRLGQRGDSAAFAQQVVPWEQLTHGERAKLVTSILLRLCIVAGSLYFFICSLSFLADGFRLVGGKGVG